jgi:hypothetical protein
MLLIPSSLLGQLLVTIGLCEGQTTTYSIRSIAPEAGLVAYDERAEWCEESEEGGENTGVTSTILVTGLDTRAKQSFKVDGDKRAEGRPAAEWAAFEKEKGFQPVGSDFGLGATPCKGRLVAMKKTTVTPIAEASAREFQIVAYGVVLTTPDGTELPAMRLGATALAEGQPSVAFAQLPGKQVLRAFIVNAKCEGGPPPGYFGEDDPGDCYATYIRRKVDLTPKAFPGVEKCLVAPATR